MLRTVSAANVTALVDTSNGWSTFSSNIFETQPYNYNYSFYTP